MATLLGGRPCVDPAVLYDTCRDEGLPLDWWGKANLFRVPLGRGPGSGCVLLTRADLDALDLTTDHVLSFDDDRTAVPPIRLQKITLLRAKCLTPGYRDDARAVYLCDVVDRRHFLAQVPIDRAYNVRDADGAGYLDETTNGGGAWTWAEVVEDLWAALDAGTAPALPFTPDGVPENLRYHAGWAWDALCDVLDRLACAVKYDPVADAFTVVRLGDTTATGAVALTAAMARLDADPKAGRTWDAYHQEPDRGRLPEKVRVLFPRRPVPTDGGSPWYAEDVTLAATAGVAAGTVVQLRDDLTAVGTGTPTNAADLTARAAERAEDWRRKRLGFERRLTLVYRDFRPELVPGETVAQTALDDHGGPMVTVLESGPDGAMEQWRPWLPPVGADLSTPATTLTSSTLLPCPVIDDGCCILFPECGTVYDCKGRPIERSAVDFATICEDGIEGVSTTVPSNCGDRTSHCGNTESACLPRCDYPATDDVLTDAGDAGDCCTPSAGSVMESSPHAGECGFWPPCVTIAGGNGTGTLAGIAFDTAANVNYDAEWPFAYTAPGGNFYITGRLVLCLESPFPGWYFAGRVYVYNPAGNSGSGDTDECGCDTVFGACPTAADDASQEIVAFHLGDKTETLRLTTACGTLDLTIAPCDTPDVPDPVEYACVAGPTGNICTPTVGGPYLNDPTCGGKCDEKDPDPPDPGPDDLCEGGEPAGGYPNLLVTIPDGPDAGAYVVGYTGGSTGTFVTFAISSPPYPPVATNISVTFNTTYAGAWGIIEGAGFTTAQAIAVSCTPFGLVFPGAIFGSSGDVTVVIA